MRDYSFSELIQLKKSLQNQKEEAVRNMSEADWSEADRRLARAKNQDKMPPRISRIRAYKGSSFGL